MTPRALRSGARPWRLGRSPSSPSRPSDPAPIGGGNVLVTCDAEIDEIAFGLRFVTGALLEGIGFVPFDRISTTTGLATTSVDPTWPFQVTNAPFGAGTRTVAGFAEYLDVHARAIDGETASRRMTRPHRSRSCSTRPDPERRSGGEAARLRPLRLRHVRVTVRTVPATVAAAKAAAQVVLFRQNDEPVLEIPITVA